MLLYADRTMRRFAVSYLTISVIIIILANLTLAIIYARQFSLRAQTMLDCLSDSCSGKETLADFAVVNAVLAGLLLIIWYAVAKARFHHPADS